MNSSLIEKKAARKRKKSHLERSSNDTLKKKRYSDTSAHFMKKKSFTNKNVKSYDSKITDTQNLNRKDNSKESLVSNTAKKPKKKMLKTEKGDAKSESVLKTKQMLKTKKVKKIKNKPHTNVPVAASTSKGSSISTVGRKKSKAKKGKKKLEKSSPNAREVENSESDGDFSDYCISDDNESDEEVLREEIQNSSIFQKIKKLMQKAPHLNPAFEGSESPNDEDDGNISEMSSSFDEDSSMESDDQDNSKLKNETVNKNQSRLKKMDVNTVSTNKKSNFVGNVDENTGFKRSAKDNSLKRTINDQNKKSLMSSNLKNKVQEKLAGAKFRFLNEKLYTETGKEAFQYFQENTEEFEDYHSGYRLQVSKWPMNPVNEIIADIQKLKKSFVVADLGCGEAKIAQTFPDRTIHSFDLVPVNEHVKACDISKVPLPNGSVDVVVFCLSLMGTNLKDYLCEAFRILKMGGILKIAEVESRIEDLGHFTNYLKSIGFTVERKNAKHKMFIFLDLKKDKQKCKVGKLPSLSLRPCLYKKR